MSRVKVVVRESTDNSIVHDYSPLSSVLKLNGRKKPDDLTVKLLMNNKCDKGDLISYVEDVTDLDYCTGIWNFQLSGLDDRGFNNDSVDIVETKFGMESSDSKFKGNYYFQSNSTNSPITILNADQTFIDLSGFFDIPLWIKPETQGVTTPIIWSRSDGTTGLEIGISNVSGTLRPFIRVSNGTTTTSKTGTTTSVVSGTSVMLRIYRGSDGIIRMEINGIVDETTHTESLSLQSGSADLKFGTDRSGSNPFVGRFYQFRFYKGNILDEEKMFQIMQSKSQPFTMKFGGIVWKKDDDTTTKTISAQSYANVLSEPIITDVTFSQPQLTDTTRTGNVYNGTQDSNSTDIFFKPDGTKMYITGDTNDSVFQYTLSTAWDVSTASYDDVKFSVQNQDRNPSGIFFKDDGTKMYIVGDETNKIYQYSLTSAWDLSTTFYDSKFFSVASQDTSPSGVFFKSDGLSMYIAGDNNDTVYQYTLSTAWDVSTASSTTSKLISAQDSGISGVHFKSDGSIMYIMGDTNDKIYQYTLSTAWNVSTASYASKNVSSQDTLSRGLFFKSDGTKLYIIGAGSDKIYQYSVSTAWDVSTATYSNISLNIGGQKAINIIKDMVNNIDDTFIVKSGSGIGTYTVRGSFIADGKFFDLTQSLAVLMNSTFYTTPRKLLIFEGNTGIDTNMLFDQDSTDNGGSTPYKISTSTKNDLSIVNSLYLLGNGVVYQYENISAGDIVHGYRINVPQFNSGSDLSSLALKLVTSSYIAQNRFQINSPALIHNIRINHNIVINNSSKGISSVSDSVESIERYYPEGKTIIHIGQYPLDFFDMSKSSTKISNGIQTNTVTYPDIVPDTVINTSSATGSWKPSNPTGTTSTTGVMAGLGSSITFVPRKTGNIFAIISGEGVNSGASNGYKIDIRYGTGTAPTNGSSLSGTVVGNSVSGINGTAKTPFSLQGTLIGLTVDNTYWLDLGQYAITAGTATITNLTVSLIEI